MSDKHTVRIIGGKYKGKLLPVRNAEGLRPTPDRVKETVFTWLQNDIENASVLDLFAGSGALGFEALSRGAANITLVELDYHSFRLLCDQANSFDEKEKIHIINNDAIKYLDNCKEKFDVVFLDPPYKAHLLKPVLKLLLNNNIISDNTLLYVEMCTGDNESIAGYEKIKEQIAGQAKYSLWKKSSFIF